MADPVRQNTVKATQPWAKMLFTVVAVVSLVVVVVAIARMTPITKRFYTDADSIREPARTAHTRDILWQPAKPLSEIVNTTADDYEPRLSADGLTLFFVRGKAGGNAEIFTSVRGTSGWSEPAPLAGVNSPYDDLGPEPSRDGTSLYFYSDRKGGAGGYDIWVAHRGRDGWQEALNLGPAVNSEFNDYGPALTPDGTMLYFASNRPEPEVSDTDEPDPNAWPATLREDLYSRDYDLYMAPIVDGGAGESQRLSALCTPFNDGAPAVSSFGDFLYFSSDRPGGQGAFDLYRSRRLRGGHERPVNLGPSVNTRANELDPGLSLGGYALYFSSDRLGNQHNASQPRAYDLYYTTSREVFSEVESRDRPPINWAALWSQIGPNLLWALLALLLLTLLWALLRDMRGRRLSLLAKCLLASATAHLLMLLLFNVWEVTASLAKEFQRRGRIQIALASPAAGSDVFTQIRGELTNVETPDFQLVETARQETSVPMDIAEATAQMAVRRHRMSRDDQPDQQTATQDAIVTHQNDLAPAPDLTSQSVDRVPLETALPTEQNRVDVRETNAADLTQPVTPTPQRAADRSMNHSREQQSSQARLTPSRSAPDDSASDQMQNSLAVASPPSESVPQTTLSQSARTPSVNSLDLPNTSDLMLPRAVEERLPETTESNPRVAAQTVVAPRRNLERIVPVESGGAKPTQLTPQSGVVRHTDSSFAEQPIAHVVDSKPTATSADASPAMDSTIAQLPLTELVLSSPQSSAQSTDTETAPSVSTATASSIRRDVQPNTNTEAIEVKPTLMEPASTNQTSDDTLLVNTSPDQVSDSKPVGVTVDLTSVTATNTVMPPLPDLAFSSLEQATPDTSEEMPSEVTQVDSTAPRAALERTVTLADATPVERHLDPSSYDAKSNNSAGSLADYMLSERRESDHRTPSYPGLLPLGDMTLTPTALSFDLGLPPEMRPPDNPYAQRSSENRLSIVERMGGSAETERAVAAALHWLAEHQSPDGHWDGADFDDRCGGCGGTTDVLSNHAQTGLALLAFLGAGHTHKGSGPYREVVEKSVRWLARQQHSDGDLRGEETMYSHGIATIALSEAFGMTRDQELADPVQRAINFIDAARNTSEGGWRYDPGQVGDTSVLGWQVMALKSAAMNGIATPAESFNTARKWLDKVSRSSSRGLYSYRPGRKYTPAMTAEGMFTQVLLGRPREDSRMRESTEYLARHLPDWDDDTNTYYWYYGTLAMYQHQGKDWSRWNDAITSQLVDHQRRDGKAAGSWDPDGEWADEGGRVYQTAICALTLEVYYRYLPLYSVERPEDAIGEITGAVVNTATGHPLAGADVRLVLPDRAPISATSGPDGRYKLFVPEVPNFFALSASHDGFVPQTRNVDAAMLHNTTLAMDFNLSPSTDELVAVEPVPDVHHLGDNDFSGSINSQFQKESEGARFKEEFELNPTQIPPYYNRAEIHMLAKGVQRRHKIVINGVTLDKRLEDAPDDGSFGEFSAPFDASILRAGTNTIEVIAKPSDSDIDDFEFVNIQIRLAP